MEKRPPLWRGIAFPPHIDAAGRLAWSQGPENLRETIRIILLTNRGERVKLPEFGAGLNTFLYEPNTTTTRRLIQERITQALERWEPRIELQSVTVEPDPADPQAAIATIAYRLVGSDSDDSLSLQVKLTGDE